VGCGPTLVLTAIVGAQTVGQLRRSAGKKKVAALPARRSGVGHSLADIPWSPWVGGVLLGLIAIAASVLSTAAGRNGGLGITTPTANTAISPASGDVTLR